MTLPRLRARVAAFYMLFALTGRVFAAIPVSTTTPYTQNFDGMGTSGTATLPADFRVDKPATVRTVGTFGSALTATSLAGGANLSSSASNGIYNFGSGTTTTGPDRAVGFLSSGTATASGNLYAQLINNTGAPLSGLQLSYAVEKYRLGINPAGFRIQLFYSTDGSTWTNAGSSFLTSFPGDSGTVNSGFTPAPGATVPVSSQLSVAIPDGGSIFLAWNYSVTTGTTTTNAQALAIDDISILGVGSGPTNPAGTGAANPSSVQAGNSTLLTVNVTPGMNPASTGIAVTADLTGIGGSPAQPFFDDGTHGDAAAGDNVFSFQATVPAATAAGLKTLAATITDAQSRTGNASISFTVTSLSTPPTGVTAANPNSLAAGASTLLTVSVTPGTNPASTGIAVSADLAAIGGSSQQFFDDGTHGDLSAGDNVFSFQATVAPATSPGLKSLPVTINDAQSRSGSASISLTVQGPPPPTTVKISEVYGGGGNSGSTYKNDFIEIFNQAATPVDVSLWSVQYASANQSTWQVTPLCVSAPCVIAPGHYFLVKESQGTGGTTDLPAPDATGTVAMGASQAQVALVAHTTALTGACPTDAAIVDFVGYGVSGCANSTPVLSNTTAAVRKGNGCVDTDNSAGDFVIIGPIPRNSSAPPNSCASDPSIISGLGTASPASLEVTAMTVLTVNVTPATSPIPSTNLKVTADLTALGGSASQQFFDDGTHGDTTAGDNIFSVQVTIGAAVTTGAKYLTAHVSDAQGRSADVPVTVTVQSPTCGVEFWNVKTGTDADALTINLGNVINTTIDSLRSIPIPFPPDGARPTAANGAATRIPSTEFTVYRVNATLTLYKLEDDVDYHLVLQDENSKTIVVEVPSPACIGAGSPFAAGVANARAKMDARLSPQGAFQTANLPVQVKGVGFFDILHGQTGVAPNGIELHPVLDLNFTTPSTALLTSDVNPSQFGQAVTFTVKVSAGATTPTGAVTLLDGGAPLASNTLDPAGQATFILSNLSSGPHTLTASYEGDSASTPSKSAILNQLVNMADQTISFAPLPGRTFGDADFSVNATATSGLAVSFSIQSGPATITGNLLHLTGAGTVVVRASQAGNSNYNPAPNVDQSFVVAKANQTITFAALPDRTFGDAPFAVSATGGASGQPVTFSASGTCTISGSTVAITTAGSCTITAFQAGDSNYNDATPVPRLFNINKAVQQLVTVSAPADATFGQTGLAAVASGGSGTGAYSFSAGSSPACAVGLATGSITVTSGTGTCSITAARAGDVNYFDSGASAPAVVAIHKAASATAVVSSKNPTYFGESVTFTATITSTAGTPSGTVQFTVDGSPLGGPVTLSGGNAGASTAALSVGAHTILATFNSSSFETSQKSLIQTVFTALAPAAGTACNGSYNGTFTGNITVAAGQTCMFTGGGVTGNITENGGSLVLNGAAAGANVQIHGGTFSIGGSSSIKGNLEVQNLPDSSTQNQICGVNLNGNLQYQNSGAPVAIGAATACPGNTVGGDLQIGNNTADISIFNNAVTGNLQIQNNTASVTVVGNSVTKNLQCGGNTTIAGNGNTAQQKQGQCSSF